MEKKVMSIILEDGTVDQVEILLSFEFNDNKKEYVVYTKNETDENGNITIYISSVTRDGDTQNLVEQKVKKNGIELRMY